MKLKSIFEAFYKKPTTINGVYVNWWVMYIFQLFFLCLCFFKAYKGNGFITGFFNENAVIWKTISILTLLICIPVGLKLFSVKIKSLKKFDSEEYKTYKLNRYGFWNAMRTVFIFVPFFLNLFIFADTKDISMLYCAGIAIVAFLFCIPSKKRMLNELDMEEEIPNF